MFTRLPESNAKRQRRTGGFVVSTLAHAALIALAVRATGLTAAPTPKAVVEPVVWTAPKLPPDAPPTTPPRANTCGDCHTELARELPAIPPVITADISDGIPRAGTMDKLLEGVFETRTRVAGRPGMSPNVADGPPFTADVVEKAVVALPGSAQPRYPSMLQNVGLEGDVRTQFVVDTLGRVERLSVHVLESTHEMFTTSVRDALARARFQPAEVGGRKVRQLVEQTFTFRITR